MGLVAAGGLGGKAGGYVGGYEGVYEGFGGGGRYGQGQGLGVFWVLLGGRVGEMLVQLCLQLLGGNRWWVHQVANQIGLVLVHHYPMRLATIISDRIVVGAVTTRGRIVAR